MKYQVKRALWNDYWMLLGTFVPPVFVGVGIWTIFSGELTVGEASFLFVLGLVSALFLARRLFTLERLFEQGIPAEATVTKKSFYRDRGRIKYKYSVDGAELTGSLYIHKTKATKAIQAGDTVSVLVDPRNYKKAVIRSLYE